MEIAGQSRQRRRTDTQAIWCAGLGIFVMAASLVYAQTQDAINIATLFERVNGVTQRLDAIEWYIRTAVAGVIANLLAFVISIRGQRKQRR